MTRFGYVMTTYFCVLGIGIASFLPVPLRLVWNASASVPIGLYGLEPPRGLRVGDLVAVAPSRHLADFMTERGYLGRGVPLMKHVSALPGWTVCRLRTTITVDGVARGGRSIATAKGADCRSGRVAAASQLAPCF